MKIKQIFIFFTLLVSFNDHAKDVIVYYPRSETDIDKRSTYPTYLLKKILSTQGIILKPSTSRMTQSRSLTELNSDSNIIHVVWSMTSIKREENYRPIRIPIYKGLIGLRLMIVRKNDNFLNNTVNNFSQIKKLRGAQGHDWPDLEILRSNDLNILGLVKYQSIFKFISISRADYFPRSIVEIWDEIDTIKLTNLDVDKSIAFYYPTALYYFVGKKNKWLAKKIESGFKEIIESGEFDEIFNTFNLKSIRRANLEKRKIYRLKNNLLPPNTPLENKKLWFKVQ